MLSISPISNSAGGASRYYLNEEKDLNVSDVSLERKEGESSYYLKEQGTEKSAQWYGNLAQEKGLIGKEVNEKTLNAVLGGDVGGESVVLKRDNRLRGYDLTFSAPKSVSLLALVGGDKRLVEAHQQAVKFALSEIEKDTAQSRIKNPITGDMQYNNTKNLIFAMVQHKTSREEDPQLHTHSLMANITRDSDNKLKALASCVHQTSSEIQGTMARIYNHQKYYTSLYQSQLSRLAQALGYETEGQGNNLFEIKGIPQDVLERFSTRSQQIKEQIDTFGIDSQAAKEVAAKDTRKAKQYTREENLHSQWQQKTKDFDIQGFIEQAMHKDEKPKINTDINPRAVDAIDRAISSLQSFSTHFSYEKIIENALNNFIKGEILDALDLKRALDLKINNKMMVPVSKDGTMFTTTAALEQDKNLIKVTQNAKIKSQTMNTKSLKQLKLSKDNQQALKSVLTGSKEVSVLDILGNSQQAATSILHAGSESGQRVHIVTPNNFAKTEAQEHIRYQSHTATQWIKNLFRKEHIHSVKQLLHNKDFSPSMRDTFVVDSANKLDKDTLISMVDYAKQHQSRIIFLNDSKSKQRCNAIDVLKQGHVEVHNWVKTRHIDASVHVHEHSEYERQQQLVNYYCSLKNSEYTQVLSSAKESNAINFDIRNRLQQQGSVSRTGTEIKVRNAVHLSEQQKEVVQHYKKNMILTSYEKKWGRVHQYEYKIEQLNRKNNTLVLSQGKEKLILDPSSQKFKSRNFSIDMPGALKVCKGDKLFIERDHFKSGLEKSQSLEVIDVTRLGCHFRNKKNSFFVPHHQLEQAPMRYDYARPFHQMDKTKEHQIVMLKSYAASKELLHDTLQQGTKRIDFFTDDKNKIASKLEQSSVQPSAMQHVLQAAGFMDKFVHHQTQETLLNDVNQALMVILEQDTKQGLVQNAVHFALSHISEKEAAMTQKELIVEAIKYAFEEKNTSITQSEIIQKLDQMAAQGKILSAEYHDGTRWTTKTAYETEVNILNRLEQEKGTVKSLAYEKDIDARLAQNEKLTPGQKSAIHLITTTQDRFIGIQGFAGTGKSTMLTVGASLVKESQKHAHEHTQFIGLAPTHAAVNELQDKGIKSQTAQSLLKQFESHTPKHNEYKNTVFLLDESSMTSNQQIDEFTKIVQQGDGRVVFLGDMDQLTSQQAGKPFELAIKKHVIDHVVMKDIVRQKDGNLLSAVHHIIDKDVSKTLHHLKSQAPFSEYQELPKAKNNQELRQHAQANINQSHSVVSTFKNLTGDSKKDQDLASMALPQAVALEYLSRTPESQKNSLIIAYTNQERDEISTHIRTGLKQQKQLEEHDIAIPRLRQVSATRTELSTMMPYKEGQIITLGKHGYYVVKHVDKNNDMLSLIDTSTGTSKPFFPKKSRNKMLGLWEKNDINVSQGDRLITRKSQKEKGIKGNDEFIVTHVDSKVIHLKNASQELKINHQDLSNAHWDYGYTRTADLAQGATYEHVITAIRGKGQLTNIRRAYIDITRASKHVKLFTDNTDKMIHAWLNQTGNKTSAIEVLKSKRFEDISLKQESKTVETAQNQEQIKVNQKMLDEIKIKYKLEEKQLQHLEAVKHENADVIQSKINEITSQKVIENHFEQESHYLALKDSSQKEQHAKSLEIEKVQDGLIVENHMKIDRHSTVKNRNIELEKE